MTDRKASPAPSPAVSSPASKPPGHGATAAQIAGGSSIVLAGGILDRGLRFVVNWFLSGALGPEVFGIFTWAVTWGSTLSSFAPLGLDTGVVLFTARYRRSGELNRAKAALLFGAGVSFVMGIVAALGLVVAGPLLATDPERLRGLAWAAALLLPWTPLLYLVGALRAAKDMRRSSLAFQVVLPVVFLVGAVALVKLGFGIDGAFAALFAATALGALAAAKFAWRHYSGLIRDRSVRPAWEPGTLLAFSIPQGLTAAAFRLNGYMDVLMLGFLATNADVGIYKIAAGLAAFGTLPSNAVASMFNPFIAELVYVGETERLDALLKTVTRWLIVVSAPVYLVLMVLPDLILGIYDPAYATALVPLLLLVGGQAIQTACAPTMRLIPMSGHAVLNLVNGLVALALNVALNAWLIPKMGAEGAAWATGITLAAWSVWRVVEVRWLLKCFPFDWRSAVVLGVAAGSGLAAAFFGHGHGLGLRLALLAGTWALLAGSVLLVSRTDADRELAQRFAGKLRRLRGKGTP
jgi:O-antigen/teichoic acid export membrane protein